MTENTFTPADFRRACGLWATGVSIVTTRSNEGTPFGLTMNAVTSLSLDPPMLLVCVDKGSDTLAPMLESRTFCVNVLTSEQQALSNRFAKKGADKFDGVGWRSGVSGVPVIESSLVAFQCQVENVFEGGDHHIFCGTVIAVDVDTPDETEPLLYYGGGYAALTRP